MKVLFTIFTILLAAAVLAAQSPTPKPMATPPSIRVVRAKAGDTVTIIAERYGANPVEVAKFNGLLPNSVLGAGREIKLPSSATPQMITYSRPSLLDTANCFSDQKIEEAVTKLPPNFHGYDIRKIAELLESRRNIVKGEFETTGQFKERREKEQKKPLLGSIELGDLLLFEVNGSFKYDADQEEMSVSFEIPNWDDMQSPKCNGDDATYRSSGVKVNFGESSSTDFNKKTWMLNFPVKLSEARTLKPSLRLLLVARLGEMFGSAFTYESKRYPYESYRIINLQLQGFWISNLKSGAIISKQGVKFSEIVPPKSKYADQVAEARNLYSQGKDDEALSVVRRVLANDPMNAECYLLVGKIRLRQGDIYEAMSAFKTAVFWDNRLIEAHTSIGMIYVSKGDCLQAKNYAASANEIDPTNSEAKRLQQAAERCR